MKKVLIFGVNGMIGHAVYDYLNIKQRYHVVGVAHRPIDDRNIKRMDGARYYLDVCCPKQVDQCLKAAQPDIVINAQGLLIKASERNTLDAFQVNSQFPIRLSKIASQMGYKVIQLSTDCVFSGIKGAYNEQSEPDGTSAYAISKALGENITPSDLLVRTSVVGPELRADGTGLLHWFLSQQGTVKGYVNTFWTGVSSLELARGIDQMITQDISGIYHFVPRERISKYDLLLLFQASWPEKSLEIVSKVEPHSDKSLVNSRDDLSFEVKSYNTMVRKLKEWIIQRPLQYPAYQ